MDQDTKRHPDAFERFTKRFPHAQDLFEVFDKKDGLTVVGYNLGGRVILVAERQYPGEPRAQWWDVFVPVANTNDTEETFKALEALQ